jgi:replicative DNA helicase
LKPTGQDLPIFINLPARIDNGDLIIVEGEIDSLHAKALGFNNVVCVGRNDVNDEQLIDAQRRGFTSVTICLDREPQKDNETTLKALKIGNQAHALGFDVFVMELPELNAVKTDLDNYLTAMGKDAFTDLIANAPSLPIFKASTIAREYATKLPLSEKDEHSLRKEIITAGLTVAPGLLPSFQSTITEALGIDFDKDAITLTIEELQSEAKLHQAGKDFTKLLNDTAKSEGTISDKAQKLKKGLGEIEAKSTDLNKYLQPNNWADFVAKLNATPQGLRTGYIMGNSKSDPETGEELNELLIPNKAITIIAGRSGHGKTTAMLNITLQLLKHNDHLKRIYFFTYEMPDEQLIERALLSFVGHGTNALFSKNPSGALHTLISKGSNQYIKAEYRDAVQSYLNQFKTEYIDTGRLTFVDARNKPIEEIRATITALRKRGEIDAVVIDYIQKFSSNQVKGTTGTALMKYVCDELNGLANDTSLPIITGAQFNRNVDFLYQVSELAIREADDITHLGALILGIYNNDIKQKVANNDATDEDKDKQSQYGHPNTFYVEVLKNRFGTPGIGFNMAYNGPLQTLGNYYHGAGVIGIDQQAETTQPKILPRATRPEKPLTLNTQLNRIKEWAKDQANAGIDIEKGLQIFTENNPSITITEAHTIAYNSVYKTTVTNNQRKAQVIEEAKQKQDKKTKPTK